MFKIHINDGTTEIPEDDICYIIAKEGIFLKKKLGIMESIAPVKDISILQPVEKMAKMNIKKIPASKFANVITFFKEVYNKFHGESIVLLFYDEVKKVYKIVPPQQKVNGAACDYDRGIVIEGMKMIGTIHSHASFSAFHSGTDDSDEQNFDGLHITIGHVNQDNVSVSASIVANGSRFIVEPEAYVEKLKLIETTSTPNAKTYRWMNGKLQEVTTTQTYTSEKRYTVEISDRHFKLPNNWMNMVERKVYTPVYNNAYNFTGRNNWGQGYDPSLWNKNIPSLIPTSQGNNHIYNVGPSANIKPIEFPPHIQNESDIVPCLTCSNRCHKLTLEEEFMNDEPDVFQCQQCFTIVVDDSADAPICNVCKTDEYLIQLIDEQLPDNYTPNIEVQSAFVQCHECGQTFHLKDDVECICPFCYSPYYQSKEDQTLQTIKNDQGDFLDPTVQEINNMISQEELIERIPEPDSNSVPIKSSNDRTLLEMFKNVFGGKKN